MRREHQVKVQGEISQDKLLASGFERLGCVVQKDFYLMEEENRRIREEGGQFFLVYKSEDVGERARVREVTEVVITGVEAKRLMHIHGVRAVVCKNRTIYRFRGVVVTCDDVEHLGKFIELRASHEKILFEVLSFLGFDSRMPIRESYLDLMLARELPRWFQVVLRFHGKIGEFVFGVTSGILTTSGLLVGVYSGTQSRLAVVVAIATIAIADSFSDAFGMYMSKTSERGVGRREAIRYACGTFIGKFVFPLTFIIPILFCSLRVGVMIDLIWGILGLVALSIEQSVVAREPIFPAVMRNVGLAVIIVIMSLCAGGLIERIVCYLRL